MCRPTNKNVFSKYASSPNPMMMMMTPVRVDAKRNGAKNAATAATGTTTPDTVATSATTATTTTAATPTDSYFAVTTPVQDIFRADESMWYLLETPGSPHPYRHIIHERYGCNVENDDEDMNIVTDHHTEAPSDFSNGRTAMVLNDEYDDDDNLLFEHSELIMPVFDDDRLKTGKGDIDDALKIPVLSSSSSSSSDNSRSCQFPRQRQPRQRSQSDIRGMMMLPAGPTPSYRLRPRPRPMSMMMMSTDDSNDNDLTWPTSSCNNAAASSETAYAESLPMAEMMI
jgi:hypothetical protein